MNENKNRVHWASKLGFLLATAGSAVGLGNLWKFPYMAGLNGGFLFIVVSLVVVFLIGMPVMMSEMALGRHTQKGPVGAYSAIDKEFRIIGILPTAVAFLILSYYSVIGGWVLKYLFMYVTGGIKGADTAAVFASFVGNPW
ncbi:MAG: sodium-dependent transporter, partial [Clostridia bacterium]|nr:sodium-dependent transporter [Clostridia bacterium]